jgi:hypothetical protein
MSAERLMASDFAALPDLVHAHAADRPDHLALVEGDEALTYAGLAVLIDRITLAFAARRRLLRRNGRHLRADLDQLRSRFLWRSRRGRRGGTARAVLDADESHDDSEGRDKF